MLKMDFSLGSLDDRSGFPEEMKRLSTQGLGFPILILIRVVLLLFLISDFVGKITILLA